MGQSQRGNRFQDVNLKVVRDQLLKSGESNLVRHNDIMLGIHDRGWHRIIRGGRPMTVPERRFCVFWAMTPYQSIDFPPGTSSYYATIPLQTFLSWRISSRLTDALLAGHFVADTSEGEADWDIHLFDRLHQLHQQPAAETQKIILLEIEVRLRRIALEMSAPTPLAQVLESDVSLPSQSNPTITSRSEIDKVAGMARFIAENYHQAIEIADIAKEVNLHPNYAMQLFRRTCGFTVLHYITQHRVWGAQRLLITTDLKLSEVSFQCGFGSEDRLYPVFRKYCGCSPRTYRLSHQN